MLHAYQKEGCSWMWGLHRQGIGGILGDEMGLGKTVQLAVHYNSLSLRLRDQSNGKDAGVFLIACPATVLFHWLREMHKWVPSMRCVILHSLSKTGQQLSGMGDAAIDMALRRLRRDNRTRGLVVLLTYDGVRRYKKPLLLRNPNVQITMICKTLPAFHRLILSGTPIQNNLIELWSLIDFCYPGRLGSIQAFETEPILLRRRKDDPTLGTALPDKTEQKTTAFRAITTLRKLCNHPALLKQRLGEEEKDSGKLLVLSKVLPLWHSEGHKVLLFAQTQGMLNLIELMMREFNFRYLRLDGSTPVSRREGIIDKYNSDPDVFVIILTTRTGGVGISLTAANRVVLVDPDWNPQTDVQARERAWRLGQKRDVTIYRLITRGTIEEKIYQRQIFKILLSNRILDNPNQKAFFSKSDISDLFQLTEEGGNSQGKERMPTGSTDGSAGGVGGAAATPAVDDGSTERDRRLLKVLYDGKALSGVHDHEFLEPGVRTHTKKMSAWEREKAAQSASRAVANLSSSAQSFDVNAERATTKRSNFRGAAFSSSSASSAPPHELAGQMMFGRQSAGGPGGAQGSGSAGMLAGLRAKAAGKTTVSGLGTLPVAQQGVITAVPSAAHTSLEENITRRLSQLFSSDAGTGGASNRRARGGLPTMAVGLRTEYVLSKFRDVGDQYAPVFRETLRKVAYLKDGKWYKK
eukprot:GSChrysophyteH2.ASY1.ANO1.1275.1 assembled CDS